MVSEKGGITSDKAIKLLNFLRGTVYWGIPETQQGERKDPGNNSIFFEKDKNTGRFMLVMSNKGKKVLFGGYEKGCDKKHIIWQKVSDQQPHISWTYTRNNTLKKENFDMTDAYACVLGYMQKNQLW